MKKKMNGSNRVLKSFDKETTNAGYQKQLDTVNINPKMSGGGLKIR